MTLPSVVRDLLMFAPSFNCCPVAPVDRALSEPARSTKLMRDTFSVSRLASGSCRFWVSRSVKTACDREDLEKQPQ